MFPKKLACIFLALLMPFVQASANDLIFKCDVKNHKQISLHTKSGDVIYSFGRIGEKPEFELSRKNNKSKRISKIYQEGMQLIL